MHDVREPTRESGALYPSHMTARFRLGDAIEIPERVLHSCHLCTMFPGVLLDIRTQVTSDLDPPLGHKSRQQLHPDLIDQSVKAVDAAVGTRFFHHLVKTPHESSLSQEISKGVSRPSGQPTPQSDIGRIVFHSSRLTVSVRLIEPTGSPSLLLKKVTCPLPYRGTQA